MLMKSALSITQELSLLIRLPPGHLYGWNMFVHQKSYPIFPAHVKNVGEASFYSCAWTTNTAKVIGIIGRAGASPPSRTTGMIFLVYWGEPE